MTEGRFVILLHISKLDPVLSVGKYSNPLTLFTTADVV